ncbi:recombinase family protein [Clostridium aestuarii]|uniref:Recombinase family protein n=1 Tax=Clostridium aestuarii TaxID=338193 RepID=A0ABT4CWA0_9CLOT|nr:recombinase family protein [Clostridium aestuarii]MCY6483255.1 recombinase family protein [Clostridium aestuarii]
MNKIKVIEDVTITNMVKSPENYAAIYARQSNPQSKSLDFQVNLGIEIADTHNLFIYNVYEEQISATKIRYYERPEFNKLLEDAAAGCFKTVIVFRRDRLARLSPDFIDIKNFFKNHNIKILYSNEGEFQAPQNYVGDFIENIIMAVDELEPKIVTERTTAGRKKKRERREYSAGKYIPFGLKIDEPNYPITNITPLNSNSDNISKKPCTEYIKDKKKAEFIETLFQKYTENNEITGAAELFREIRKDKTITIPTDFKKSSIPNVIQNPIYANLQLKDLDYKLKDSLIYENNTIVEVNKNFFHPCSNVKNIIDEDLWYEAFKKWKNTHTRKRKPRKTVNYLLKGLLYCNKCGKKLSLKGKIYKCNTPQCIILEESYIVNNVLEKVINDLFSTANIITAIDKNINSIKKQLSDKNKSLNKNKLTQRESTLKYVNNAKNEKYKLKLKSLLNIEKTLKSDIGHLKRNINYHNQLRSIVLQLINFNNIHELIAKMKINYETTQKFLNENIKKVFVCDENSDYRINDIKYK